MIRSEFLQTIEGMKHESLKRNMSINYLEYYTEPKSKNSISKLEKKAFRKLTKDQLKYSKRRPYQSDIILQIDFVVNKKNPPSLQSLVKNYLDLLHKEDDTIDRYKKILFQDDSNIRLLITRIQYGKVGIDSPSIRIKTYNYNYFIKDLQIAKKLQSAYEDEIHFKSRSLDTLFETLSEHESTKKFCKTEKDLDFFELETHMIMRQIQESYLHSNSLGKTQFLRLLNPLLPEKNEIYDVDDSFNEIFDKLIYISSSILELEAYPLKEGDTSVIKNELKIKLEKFKERHSLLFPLIHPIKLIIIAREPSDIKRKIDLDNLARTHIIPLVTEFFAPPIRFSIPKFIKDDERFNFAFEEDLQGLPTRGILSYEVIKIPTLENTNGKIEILINDGFEYDNVWSRINSILSSILDL